MEIDKENKLVTLDVNDMSPVDSIIEVHEIIYSIRRDKKLNKLLILHTDFDREHIRNSSKTNRTIWEVFAPCLAISGHCHVYYIPDEYLTLSTTKNQYWIIPLSYDLCNDSRCYELASKKLSKKIRDFRIFLEIRIVA